MHWAPLSRQVLVRGWTSGREPPDSRYRSAWRHCTRCPHPQTTGSTPLVNRTRGLQRAITLRHSYARRRIFCAAAESDPSPTITQVNALRPSPLPATTVVPDEQTKCYTPSILEPLSVARPTVSVHGTVALLYLQQHFLHRLEAMSLVRKLSQRFDLLNNLQALASA